MPPTSPQGGRRLRRRLAVATLAGAVAVPLALPTAYADHGSLKHRQHQVHRSIQHAQGDLDDSSQALRRAQARLDSARTSLGRAERRLAATRGQLRTARAVDQRVRARLARARAALTQAQDEVTRARAAVVAQRDQIGTMALENYQSGDPALLGLVAMFGPGDPADVTTQLNAVHGVMTRQSDVLDELRADKDELITAEAKAAAAKQQVAARRAETARNVARKQRLEHAAAAQRREVARFVTRRRAAEHRAARIRAHDIAQLRTLQRQEQRIRQQILARARHQRNRVVANTGGLLQRPVPGYITSPYGWRMHPIYHYWGLHDGDDFHAPCGTPERAAGSGRVVSEYYSSVWGNRLFLDLGRINGHNFTVIYNHIERYAVGSGAQVGRGQVVAYAGTTGWSTGCHLHFTVLRDGTAVNPMDYM